MRRHSVLLECHRHAITSRFGSQKHTKTCPGNRRWNPDSRNAAVRLRLSFAAFVYFGKTTQTQRHPSTVRACVSSLGAFDCCLFDLAVVSFSRIIAASL